MRDIVSERFLQQRSSKMATLTAIMRRLEKLDQIDNKLQKVLTDNEMLKAEVRKQTAELIALKQAARTSPADVDVTAKSNIYMPFRGVLPSPNHGRSSKESSFLSVGRELKSAIASYNESKEDSGKIPQIPQSDMSFSRMVMKSAETVIGGCRVFGVFMKKATYNEIKAVYNNDSHTFEQAHESLIRKMIRLHPVLSTAEGNWAADTAIKRRLIVMKEDAKRSRDKEQSLSGKKNTRNRTSKNRENAPDRTRSKRQNLTEENESWESDEDVQLDPSRFETDSDSAEGNLEAEACALHSDEEDCEVCADKKRVKIPPTIQRARNYPLQKSFHIPTETESEDDTDENEIVIKAAGTLQDSTVLRKNGSEPPPRQTERVSNATGTREGSAVRRKDDSGTSPRLKTLSWNSSEDEGEVGNRRMKSNGRNKKRCLQPVARFVDKNLPTREYDDDDEVDVQIKRKKPKNLGIRKASCRS